MCLSTSFGVFSQETKPQTPATPTKEEPKAIPVPTTDKANDGGTGKGDDTPKDPNPDPKKPTETASLNAASDGQGSANSSSISPEANLANRLQDIAVNLYTGTPMIGYPIATLKEVDVTVPVSINYNATGMKGHDVASWCGMNWQLSAGGFLSRIVRNVPDEGRLDITNLNAETAVARKGFYKYGANISNTNNTDDSEPDWFFLNVGGASYKFMLEPFTGKARFFPDADIDVQVTFTVRPDGQGIVGKFSNWIFKMPNGMIYEFSGIAGTTESSFEAEANFNFNGHSPYYRTTNLLTSGWYLTKIMGTYGHPVNFTYDASDYAYYKLSEQYTTFNGGGGHCPTLNQIQNKKINRVYIEGATPKKIEGSTLEIVFNECVPFCFTWVNPFTGITENVCTTGSCIANREDVDNGGFTSNATLKLLQNIVVRDKTNPSAIPVRYNFEYEYLGQDFINGYQPIPYGYTLSSTNPYHWEKRLFLKRIIMPDTNISYRFKYRGAGQAFPSRLTLGLDHWGFFNGKSTNQHLIGSDLYTPSGCTTDADRSTTFDNLYNDTSIGETNLVNIKAFFGTLEQIDYSLGASTKFYYEPHIANNYSGLIGGVRIKAIKYQDKISSITQIKKYDYTKDNSTQSGFLFFKPLYRFNDLFGSEVSSSSVYGQMMLESSKPSVGYAQVKEILCDSIGTPSLGYTIKNFSQDERDPIVAYDMYRTIGSSFYLSPGKYTPDHDYFGGTESSTRMYNQAGQLLMKKTQRYQLLSDGKYSIGLKKVFSSGQSFDSNKLYTLSTFKFRMIGDSTTVYDQNGANPVINWTTLDYSAKHNQVIKSTTKDGRGNDLESHTRYVADYVFGSDSTAYDACYDYDGNSVDCSDPTVNPAATQTFYNYTPHIPTGSFAKGIWQLQQRHILHGVVETYTKQAGATIRASLNRYYADSTSDHKAGLLYENYVLDNVPTTTFGESIFSRATDEIVKSSDYGQPRSRMESYTNNGQVRTSKVIHGAKAFTIYDSYDVLPKIIIRNFADAGNGVLEKGELWTQYEYDNRVFGASKEIAPNSLEVRTEYYPDGKILCVKDKDGYILKHYEYLFKGLNTQFSTPNLATDTTYNRIITRTPRGQFTSVTSLDYTDCMISIVQMDASGRTLQSIGFRGSPTGKDLISTNSFDKFGRSKYSFLPVEANQITGAYVSNYLRLAKTFYRDSIPYSEVSIYETSPMNRVYKSYGAGKAWRDNNKAMGMSYLTEGSAIKKYTILSNGDISSATNYGTDYELSVKIMTDERGSTVKEYTDKSGNVIQKSVQVDDAGTYLNTAYVYNNYGQLKYIVPPNAFYRTLFNETNNPDANFFEENIYGFRQDGRGRVIEKHTPGAGWSKVVYNRLDQAVVSQDSQETLTNTWSFVKYDGLGKIVQTGQFVSNNSRTTLQNAFDTFLNDKQFEERSTTTGNVQQYTNRSYPSIISNLINDASLKTVNYYDDYDWRYNDAYSGSIADYSFQSNPFNATAYSNLGNYQARGLTTGGLSKIEIYGDFLFPSTSYYDDKNRIIQSIGYHNLLARNQSDMQYNFVGETLQSRMIYRKQGANDNIRTIEQTLDHIGRRKEIFYSLKDGTVFKVPRFKMVGYSYDAIGRLQAKGIQPTNAIGSSQTGLWTNTSTWLSGTIPTINDPVVINQGHIVTIPASTTVTAGSLFDKGTLKLLNSSTLQLGILPANRQSAALQTINYIYDLRGNVRGVNLDNVENVSVSQDQLFSYRLDRHEDQKYFDGSISKQTWKSYGQDQTVRSYQYFYDRANRLINANYSGGKAGENFSIPTVAYDGNGNITFMSRMGKNGTTTVKIDSLDYQYLNGGNKLKTVTDVAPDAQSDGFKNGSNSGDDYDYYADGKLKKDLNRNISLIEYNFLDLVSKISRSNGDYIEYKYTSTGTKRQTKRSIGGVESYTLFDGEMIYTYTGNNPSLSNFIISEIQNEEGRFVNNRLEYGYTDHLGNLRLSYRDSLGTAVVVQSHAYDAWGMEIKPLRYGLKGALADKYTWQGKEDLSEDGLEDWSNFGWRIEDRTLGRWFTPDPADQFQSISPFAYCANNPVSHIDPDGRVLPALAVVGIAMAISGATYAATVGFSRGGFDNWNWNEFGRSVIVGGASSIFTMGVGEAFGNVGTLGNEVTRAVMHGHIQGTLSAVQGGNYGTSFLSGAIGSGFSSGASALNLGDGGVILSGGLSGGVGSSLSGGNFFEGFGQGSIIALANHSMHKPKPKFKTLSSGGKFTSNFIEKGYDFLSGAIKETYGDAVRITSTLGSSLANNFSMIIAEGVHEGSPNNSDNAPYRPYEVDLKSNSWIPVRDSNYMGGVSIARETKMYNSTVGLGVDVMTMAIPEYKFIPNAWVRWGVKWQAESIVADQVKEGLKR